MVHTNNKTANNDINKDNNISIGKNNNHNKKRPLEKSEEVEPKTCKLKPNMTTENMEVTAVAEGSFNHSIVKSTFHHISTNPIFTHCFFCFER